MPEPSIVEPEHDGAEVLSDHEAIMQENDPTPTEAEPELPKIWNIEDPFQYAPPRPEGNHWSLLLEPVLKEEQMQCDAWKDEVQNLLIFAGLFSAVVTAFIIESYKSLQQSPNDVMISLLAHIAARLDGPLNNNTSIPLPVQQPFSPTASSIRVNAFWFISLVLSLTTVLIGITSLQWLRVHLSYSDLSEREKYAVSIMRYKALRRWHVDKVFAAMPLLLQGALILFLDPGNGVSLHALDNTLSAPAYYAFSEISELTLLPLRRPDYYYRTPEDLYRQSAYLHDLLSGEIPKDKEATLTDVFDLYPLVFQILERPLGDTQTGIDSVLAMLIHHQNASLYLRDQYGGDAPFLSTHRTELRVRLMQYFYRERPQIRNVIMDKKLRFPGCLVLTQTESLMGPDFKNDVDFNEVAWQVAHLIRSILQEFQNNHVPDLYPNSLVYNPLSQSMTSIMDTASFLTTRSLASARPSTRNHKLDFAVRYTFYSIFSLFEDLLSREMLSWTSTEGQPSLVFYLAALYMLPLIEPLRQDPRFQALYYMVLRYKRRTIDLGITNPMIEQRLGEDPYFRDFSLTGTPFSGLWWHEFDPPTNPSNANSNGLNTPSIVMYYPFDMSQDRLSQV